MEAIETAFSKIGSRVKVDLSSGQKMSVVRSSAGSEASRMLMDVSRDGKGEFFHITLNGPVDLQVMNMDRASKHLLLFARDAGNEKYRYLCGRDERGLFAAAVPGAVSNVVSAMEALKPQPVIESQHGMSTGERNKRRNRAFRRQGEWFFIPAPDLNPDRVRILFNEPIRRGRSKPHIVGELYRRGGKTAYVSHKYPNGLDEEAYRKLIQETPAARRWGWSMMRKDMDVFGRGRVTHPDHKTIVLNGWHKILPNQENKAWFIKTLVFLD